MPSSFAERASMSRVLNRSIATVVALFALIAGGVVVLASHASGATTPPWEVGSAKDPDEVGTLALYDSSGHQITSGSVMDSPIAAYIVGSTADSAHPKATAFMYTPKNGTAAGAWP